MGSYGFKIRVIFTKSLILYVDPEPGGTVGHIFNVVLSSQSFENQLRKLDFLVLLRTFLLSEFFLGTKFNLIIIFPSRCLKVKFLDQEFKYHKINSGKCKTDDQQEQILFPVISHQRYPV